MVHEYVRHQSLRSVWKKLFKIAGLHRFCLYKLSLKRQARSSYPEGSWREHCGHVLLCYQIETGKLWGITMNRNNGELCGDRLLLQSPLKTPVRNVCIILTYTCMEDYFHHAMNKKNGFDISAILNLYQERKYKFKKIKQLWENVADGKKKENKCYIWDFTSQSLSQFRLFFNSKSSQLWAISLRLQ